jgi:hypothetical protein
MSLPFVIQPIQLPLELTQLLSLDMKDDLEVTLNIKTFLTKTPSIKMILNRKTDLKNLEENLEKWVKAQGWLQLRDNIAAIYLSKLQENVFLNDINSRILYHVLDVENKLQPYSLKNNSRSFLFAFFLKVHNQLHPKNKLELPISFFRYMDIFGRRHEKVDYFILTLWHFIHFFDEDKFDRLFKKDISNLDTFYDLLTIDQKEIFVKNFLNYSFSINEFDLFEKRIN